MVIPTIPGLRTSLKVFTERERNVLRDLEVAFRRLGPSEIRALGTHSKTAKTLEDIEKEFSDLEKHKTWTDLVASLQSGAVCEKAAKTTLEYADEACRKSAGNRKDYKNARSIVLAELRDPALKEAFVSCHDDDTKIWEDEEVKRQANRARQLLAIGKPLVALSRFRGQPQQQSRYSNRSPHWRLWDEGREELRACGLKCGLPVKLQDAFEENPGQIKQVVRDRLISVLESIRQH